MVFMRFKFIGKPLDPFKPGFFKKTALLSFLAWIGLGADGLSSSCYGPEQSYLALGTHGPLALFIALGVIFSVFIIAISYNQVVELFPSGGGGYKVATQILGPIPGVVSGSALIVDYVLTIAISAASGADAIYSFLPASWIHTKLILEFAIIIGLIILNLRGMKESIKLLLPIFLGFFITHVIIIIYGAATHGAHISTVTARAIHEAHGLAGSMGIFLMLAFILHAFSLGSGTYTGIEAVSNNVNKLAEPRVKTGKVTMLYMAISLSLIAGGITLLYMLFHVAPMKGQTLNAVVFEDILGHSHFGHLSLIVVLLLEAGILIVASNTGFLAGPMVLANMASDNWLPRRFRLLSSRLVNSQGLLFYGIAALLILFFSRGKVAYLVILYSINVFITFTLTTLSMATHWFRNRKIEQRWLTRFILSSIGFVLTAFILIVTLMSKFWEGGFITLILTALLILFCMMVRRHYARVGRILRDLNRTMAPPVSSTTEGKITLQPQYKTAVILLNNDKALAMHCLNWIQKHFAGQFVNYVFICVGQVDVKSFKGQRALKQMTKDVNERLSYFIDYCHYKGLPATSYSAYGSDVVEKIFELCQVVGKDFPDHLYFGCHLSFKKDTWFKRLLHNGVTYVLQRKLNANGDEMLLLPIQLDF